MQALEIGHLRCVAGLDKGLEAAADQLDQATAKHDLLAEQVGLAFLLEGRLDDARASAADATGIGQRQIVGVLRGILLDCDQAGHAATLLVFAAHRVAGTLRRDHDHVNGLLRLDQVEVDIEAMGKRDGRPIADVAGDVVVPDVGLQFVRRAHHDEIGPGGGLGHQFHRQPVGRDLLRGRRARLEGDGHVLDAGIAKIERVGAPLAAIADNRDFAGLDQVEIGIPVVEDAHERSPLGGWARWGSADPFEQNSGRFYPPGGSHATTERGCARPRGAAFGRTRPNPAQPCG